MRRRRLVLQVLTHPSPFVPQPPAGARWYASPGGGCQASWRRTVEGTLFRQLPATLTAGGCSDSCLSIHHPSCHNPLQERSVMALARGFAASRVTCRDACGMPGVGEEVNALRARPHDVNAPSAAQRRRFGFSLTVSSAKTQQCRNATVLRRVVAANGRWGDQTRFAGRRRLTQCRSGLSSMPLESRAIASTVPVTELRRKRMLFFPLSSAALTTVSSSPGTVTRVPAVM